MSNVTTREAKVRIGFDIDKVAAQKGGRKAREGDR